MHNLLTDPRIPAPDHVVWCRAHDDAGHHDQYCRTDAWMLDPEDPELDDSVVKLRALQYSERRLTTAAWTPQPPMIELSIEWTTDDNDLWCWLTVRDARRVAAQLLELAARAESETGRCTR